MDDVTVLTSVDGMPLEDIWFDGNGNLVALFAAERRVHIKTWKSGNLKRGKESNLNEDLSAHVLSSDQLFYARRKEPDEGIDESKGLAPFAVNRAANLIGWAAGGRLAVKPIGQEDLSHTLPYGEGAPRALSFVNNNNLSLLFQDGRIRIWDYPSNRKLRAGANLEKRWSLWSREGDILVSSFPTGDLGVVKLQGQRLKADMLLFEPNQGSVLAASQRGEIAVGTNEGRVFVFSGVDDARPRPGIPLQTTRSIRALVFGDGSTIFAAGDFSGIYLISEDITSPISAAPAGILYIDYFQDILAYATSSSVECGRIIKATNLTGKAELVVALVSLFVSFVALWFSVDQDTRH